MSEEATTQASPVIAASEAVAAPVKEELEVKTTAEGGVSNGTAPADAPEPAPEVATEVSAPIETPDRANTNGKQTESDDVTHNKPTPDAKDMEMKDKTKEGEVVAPAGDSVDAITDAPTGGKAKGKGRKSGGVPEHKSKKLNKKASKAKMMHTDAKPGDHFFVRLKGYPLWPAIVCEESMLPDTLLKTRPVTAARADGTYRADYEDGGPKVKDRSFPVMYLQTNEFGFIPNQDLVDLDPEECAKSGPSIKKKDLSAAYQLASEQNDLQHYKDILQAFNEQREADAEAKRKLAEAKKLKLVNKEKRSKVVVEEELEDEDVNMPDAALEVDSDGAEVAPKSVKAKKRKAEEPAETPSRVDSVKKPRPTIKLNTPKTTNGTSMPKIAKDSATKATKPKSSKKAAAKAAATPEVAIPKEPEMTAEEKRVKKEKEILFLRHKLQKGLLTRDQSPKEEEMKQMSEFVTKLEGYADLEVSIIRATKINKVLKAMLKLPSIPRENEFNFKPRSQTLLDKWNKLLASEQGTPAAPTTNGVEHKTDEVKASPNAAANGSKGSPKESKAEEKASPKESPATESKEPAIGDQATPENTAKGPAVAPAALETST